MEEKTQAKQPDQEETQQEEPQKAVPEEPKEKKEKEPEIAQDTSHQDIRMASGQGPLAGKVPLPQKEEEPEEEPESKEKEEKVPEGITTHLFALRTTANREDQVLDFMSSNIQQKGFAVYSIIRPHGMRGYIFIEAESMQVAQEAAHNIPYARGILPKEIEYKEIEHMLEQVKRDINIKKNDIVEIISGPFKRETAKVSRIDKQKEDVVVELIEAAVPIPITLKLDAVKVIRRETDEDEDEE